MRRFQKWVLTLGMAAASPAVTLAGPLSSFDAPKANAGYQTGARPSNQEIANRIASVLRNSELGGHEIDVEFKNGVARLRGSVQTPEQRSAAADAVRQIPQVRKVDNGLTVQSPRRSHRDDIQQTQYVEQPQMPQQQIPAETSEGNQQMAQQIAMALKAAQFRGQGIQIQFQAGVATLSGNVSDPQTHAMAEQIVLRVPGVRGFNNQLSMSAPEAPANVQPASQMPAQEANAHQVQAPVIPSGYPLPPAGPGVQQMPVPQQLPPGYPMAEQGIPPGYPLPPAYQNTAYQPVGVPSDQGAGAGLAPAPAPVPGGPPQAAPMPDASHQVYDQPNLPNHSWPTYGTYPNYAQVTYPQQYSASAWPYIGPFYPYPQVPLGWRKVQLEWDDGYWQLNFRPRTDKWWWFMNPKNW